MIRRRRNLMPPYQVMGSPGKNPDVPRAPGHAPAAEPEVISRAPAERTRSAEPHGEGGWAPGTPVILRLPRGVAVMMGVAALVVLLIAYFVGHAVGYRAAVLTARQDVEEASRMNEVANGGTRNPLPGIAGLQTGTTTPPPAVPGTRSTAGGPTAPEKPLAAGQDPRVAGLNYFVLVQLDRTEAERLQRFMTENGVESLLVPSHNGKSFQVVALKGFRGDQLAGSERRAYEQELRRLGRLWKSQNKGASNLADMYPAKFAVANPR